MIVLLCFCFGATFKTGKVLAADTDIDCRADFHGTSQASATATSAASDYFQSVPNGAKPGAHFAVNLGPNVGPSLGHALLPYTASPAIT